MRHGAILMYIASDQTPYLRTIYLNLRIKCLKKPFLNESTLPTNILVRIKLVSSKHVPMA